MKDFEESRNYPQRLSPIRMNQGLERVVAATGYYGSDMTKQQARNLQGSGILDRIEEGQVIIGSPNTVVAQVKRIKDTLGAGVLDLNSAFQIGERTTRSIRMFGEQVLPRIADL